MADLWSLRGISWWELTKRTCRKSWDDEVFGQAAQLAFYYFLSMFPVLLLLLILLAKIGGGGPTGANLRDTLLGVFQQILPREASALLAKTVGQLNAGAVIGAGAVSAGLGSVWGALNGTWAMMAGLNKAYEVQEERQWWKVLSIAFGLTISLGIMGIAALWTMFYGDRAWETIDAQSLFFWRIIQWLVTAILLFFSLTLLYRFGPSVNDRRWQSSVLGAVIAVAIWVVSTLLLRVYQTRFSSERIYGGLNAVVVLLMWLYSTGAAVFIGGEANSEIEKAGAKARHPSVGGEKRSAGESSSDN